MEQDKLDALYRRVGEQIQKDRPRHRNGKPINFIKLRKRTVRECARAAFKALDESLTVKITKLSPPCRRV